MLRRTTALCSAFALAALAAACGGNDAGDEVAPPAAAPGATGQAFPDCKLEDRLSWYVSLPPSSIEATTKAFEKQYDVTVEALRLASGPLGTRYSAERSGGAVPADVISISSPAFFAESKPKGWFEQEPSLPALEEWPKEYKKEGRATTGLLPQLLAYNTNKVPKAEAPTEWEQLLEPRWKGEMLLGDPRAVPGYLGLVEMWFQEYGPDFLTSFAKQDYTIVPSVVPGSQQLAAGGASLVVPNSNTVLAPLIASKAPVALTSPSPTTGVEYETAISTKAASPCAARVFMNYLLTEEGQQAFNTGGGTSALGDVGGDTVPLPDGYKPLGPLFEQAQTHQAELLRLLGVEG